MESLAYAVVLRWHRFRSGVVNIVDRQVKLDVVLLDIATILSTTIRLDTQYRQAIAGVKR